LKPRTTSTQSPQGLAELAQMLSDAAITTRIRSRGDIGDALTLLRQLRNGEIRGKAVFQLGLARHAATADLASALSRNKLQG